MKIIVDKQTALKAICEHLGLDHDRVDARSTDESKRNFVEPTWDEIEFDFEKPTIKTEDYAFVLCSACQQKPQLSSLCNSCIANQSHIEDLKGLLR